MRKIRWSERDFLDWWKKIEIALVYFLGSKKWDFIWLQKHAFARVNIFKIWGNYNEASNEEEIKSINVEKDLCPFFEFFLLSAVSRLISLFWEVSFFRTDILVGVVSRRKEGVFFGLKEELECTLDTKVEVSRIKVTFLKGTVFKEQFESFEGIDGLKKSQWSFCLRSKAFLRRSRMTFKNK